MKTKRERVVVLSPDQLRKTNNKSKVRSFTINKPAQSISAAEDRAMLEDLFDDMRSDHLQHERRMEKSWEFAKSYICKD